jgi:type I restriction enzyme M protein
VKEFGMNDKIKQAEINNAAWAACDTFRGVVDAGQYKDYILVMLFLKYISDLWNDHFASYKKQFGGDDTRIRRRMERERFVLPEGASFYDLYEKRNEANIGELINIALEKIEDTNRAKLEGVFRNIDFNSETNLGRAKDRNRRLKNLLEDFNKPALDLRPSRVTEDVIGECYIYLISRFASDAGKKAGEFYTPAAVSRLLAKLAGAKPGNTICDPACGSGSLLIRAAEEVGSDNYALYGQEVNGATWALARMNMFLHAKDAARIEWCDTLNSPALIEGDQLMKFDVVVANPPFSLDKWGAEHAEADQYTRFWRGIPPKSKGDYAFITHMIEIAKQESGRVAVIVPHGVLFRGGAEGRIRQALIEENLLDAVVGLPANLFTTTGIPVAILVFDRSREKGGANEKRKDVLFIDASKEFTPDKTQNVMTETHIKTVLDTYKKRSEIKKYSHRASVKEIKENEFNLNIPRYVDTYEAEEAIDVVSVQQDIIRLETELTDIRLKMAKYLKDLGINA